MLARLATLTLALTLALPAGAASLSQQRSLYDQAKKAMDAGNPATYRNNRSALAGYPLEPYLAFEDLRLRIKTASTQEVERFIRQHDDLPQTRYLKLYWLRELAERSDWATFQRHYTPDLGHDELDCLHAEYLFISGRSHEAIEASRQLWLSATSRPACADAFAALKQQGSLTIDLQWQRFYMAAAKGNTSLASSLLTDMPANFASAGQRLLDVLKKPALLDNIQQYAAAYTTNADTVILGLRKMAKDNPDRALALLDEYSRYLQFDGSERLATARAIAMVYARNFDDRALQVMMRYDPQLQDATLSEWRNRLLLRKGRWQDVWQMTSQLPAEQASSPQWRYWRARSLQMVQPNNPQLHSLYSQAAADRDFYSFLAADNIARPYQLNHKPVQVDSATLQRVASSGTMQRLRELQARGMDKQASTEWHYAARSMSQPERLALARLGYQNGWHYPAISTLSSAQYWDDLDVRFPMAHKGILTQAANRQRIAPSWAYAIARQESAFREDARSRSGAMGLMQLMPATAKETAQRYGIPLTRTSDAYRPEINVQLGTAYLNQMYNYFGNNRILASAAYNAGPGNVRRWLGTTAGLPYDVWIESIPFDETRSYVRNVLTYSVIYGEKLGKPQKVVEAHERSITAP